MSPLASPILNPTADAPPRWLRCIPISFWMVAAILSLLFVDSLLSYYRERQVIQMVERFAGKVTTETGGPDWLRNLVGKDHLSKMEVFDRIDAIELNWSEMTDADADQLSRTANLKRLCMNGTLVTDAGLSHLSRLPNLKVLSLESARITDAGLAQLSRMTSLKDLTVRFTKVTPTGIEKLQKALPECRVNGRLASEKTSPRVFSHFR